MVHLPVAAVGGGSGGGGATFPVQAGHQGQVLFTDSANVYWSDTSVLYVNVNFEADGKTVLDSRLENNTYFLAWADLPRYLFADNNDFTPILGGGFTINVPGFNALVQPVHVIAYLRGTGS